MLSGAVVTSDRCCEKSVGVTIPQLIDGLAGETQSWLVAAKELAPSLKSLGFQISSAYHTASLCG